MARPPNGILLFQACLGLEAPDRETAVVFTMKVERNLMKEQILNKLSNLFSSLFIYLFIFVPPLSDVF